VLFLFNSIIDKNGGLMVKYSHKSQVTRKNVTKGKRMSGTMMIDSGKVDRIERTLVSLEVSVRELAVISKEAAKREERSQIESSKREERLCQRVENVEKQVDENTKMIWKFAGIVSCLVFVAGIAIKFL